MLEPRYETHQVPVFWTTRLGVPMPALVVRTIGRSWPERRLGPDPYSGLAIPLPARRRRFVPMKATCGRRKRQQEVGITHLPRETETSLVKA